MQVFSPHSVDAKRAELEIVLEALAHTPRLAKLLRFLGEKYLDGKADEITEYTIATEVFGRSKVKFDGSRDSIARVETFRLRRRLKEYYELEGKQHSIVISLPLGSYIPEFDRRAASIEAAAASESQVDAAELESRFPTLALETEDLQGEDEDAPGPAEIEIAETRHAKPGNLRKRTLIYVVAAILALLVVTYGAVRMISHYRSANSANAAGMRSSNASQTLTPGNAAQVPLRLLAGYEGSPRIDSAGAVWGAERYVHGGGSWRRPTADIARTSDPFLFQYWRTGDSTWDIPLPAGNYELHLYFVSSEQSTEDFSTFTIQINGKDLISGFDINSDAMGENIADERVFRDISPAADGKLHLSFLGQRGIPLVNAIEIVPGIPHKQLPIRLVMQRTSLTDRKGQFWQADDYFMNGRLSPLRQDVAGSPDPDLFAMERFGHFSYAIPVDTRDRYTIILHFVEFYFGPQGSGGGGVGSRVFNVICNGQTLLGDFDIYKEAGTLHVLTKTFHGLRPTAQGKLNLTFEPVVNNATVSAIEVIDESE